MGIAECLRKKWFVLKESTVAAFKSSSDTPRARARASTAFHHRAVNSLAPKSEAGRVALETALGLLQPRRKAGRKRRFDSFYSLLSTNGVFFILCLTARS